MYGLGNKGLFSSYLIHTQIKIGPFVPTGERRTMVAPGNNKKIYCTIVRVPSIPERVTDRLARPSDLLPWADPYIARLVENLQQEVRSERLTRHERTTTALMEKADLDPPSPVSEPDIDWSEEPRFNIGENVSG